jgi:hypothetical protein
VKTADELRSLASDFREIQASSGALKNDDFHALYAMDREALAKLAHRALHIILDADMMHGYTIAMLEQHVEGNDDVECCWVVSQSQKDGRFNKFSKNMGGYAPENGPPGDALVFSVWSEAKFALDHMDPDIQSNFRIYPVVVVSGQEPRTTPPRE